MKNIIKNQNGNALWLILLAVALLAFLTGVISRSSSSVNQTGGVEKARINATKLLRYTKGLELSVQQLQTQGCSENEISFEGAPQKPWETYANPNSPTDKSCHIFSLEGSGIHPINTNKDKYIDSTAELWPYKYFMYSGSMKVSGIGTSASDLIAIHGYINESTCKEINKLSDVINTGGKPPSKIVVAIGGTSFRGTFGGVGSEINTSANEISGKNAGCFKNNTGSHSDTHYFYHVLIAR